VIHPPITLENLLPIGGFFEIIHAVHKRVLWSSWVGREEVMPIHTVSLEEPLVLLINLKYCRTPDGVLIHKPDDEADQGLAGKIRNTIDGLLEESDSDSGTTVLLTDSVGQRLFLNLENNRGNGGQRHIAVFCPYWIINCTQYTIRIREEGHMKLPAGSVTAQK